MGKSREQQAAEGMANAHPIDRILVIAAGQVTKQNLDSIAVGDVKVTDPDGRVTEIAGITFNNRRNDAQA